MNPLEIAQLIGSSEKPVSRDPKSGLYLIGTKDDGVELTLAQYESGLRVLHLREKVAIASSTR